MVGQQSRSMPGLAALLFEELAGLFRGCSYFETSAGSLTGGRAVRGRCQAVRVVHSGKQHVLSQVLQRRWASPPCKLIAVVDVSTGQVNDQRGPGGAGWEKDFIEHDPDVAEQLWKTVEDDLPSAFALLDRDDLAVPDRQADLIRDCIALHWARSRAMRTAIVDPAKIWAGPTQSR